MKFKIKEIILMLFIFNIFNNLLAKKPVWINWAQNQKCYSKGIFVANSLNELIIFLKKMDKEKASLRILGSGHSWNDIVCTKGYLIDIRKLKNILNVNKENKTIKVEAGITIAELNEVLAQNSLSLSNQSAITDQTLAGAIATATHGSGNTGTFSSFIKEVELIKANGDILIISADKNPEFFAAVRTNIGSLGVIYSITLQCEDLFEIKNKNETSNLSEILGNYKKYLQENDFFQFTWNPYTDEVVLLLRSKNYKFDKDRLIQNIKNESEDNFLSDELKQLGKVRRLEEEIAIPIDFLPEALQELKKFLDKYLKKGFKIYMNNILIRFVKAEEDILLSPASGQNVAFISISLLPNEIKDYKKFYQEFETLMFKYEGRPHWGKINFLNYDKAFKLYRNNLLKFIEIKKSLDPKGSFSNSFTKKVFKI